MPSLFSNILKKKSLFASKTIVQSTTALVSQHYVLKIMNSFSMLLIVKYYQDFNNGIYTNIFSQILENRNKILAELDSFEPIYHKNYPDFKAVYDYILQTYQAIESLQNYYNSSVGYSALQDKYNEQQKILDSPALLKELFLKIANRVSGGIFPEVVITAPTLELLPEVQMYIDMYGFPPGGTFDVRKMTAIMKELGIFEGTDIINTASDLTIQNTVVSIAIETENDDYDYRMYNN